MIVTVSPNIALDRVVYVVAVATRPGTKPAELSIALLKRAAQESMLLTLFNSWVGKPSRLGYWADTPANCGVKLPSAKIFPMM